MKKHITPGAWAMGLCLSIAGCASNGSSEGDIRVQTSPQTVDVETIITTESWITKEYLGSEEVESLLSGYNFEWEEIQYADDEDFYIIRKMNFDTDGTMTLEYDLDAVHNAACHALDAFMDNLYAHAQDLRNLYGESMLEAESADVFKSFIARHASGQETDDWHFLIESFADNVITYYFGADEYTEMEGTYTITDFKIQVSLSDGSTDEFTYNNAADTLTGSAKGTVYKGEMK